MAHEAGSGHRPQKRLKLPSGIASAEEVARLLYELTAVDDSLVQLRIRAAGTNVKMPKTSRLMDELVEQNDLNLLQPADRTALKTYLTALQERAPVLHISFSADPTPTFIGKLVIWLRREIHPDVLLTIGLQPSIGAGCVVRTTNRYFDLSLRQSFAKHRDVLLKSLSAAPAASPAPRPAPPAPASAEAAA